MKKMRIWVCSPITSMYVSTCPPHNCVPRSALERLNLECRLNGRLFHLPRRRQSYRPDRQSWLSRKSLYQALVTGRQPIRRRLIEEVLAQEQAVRTVAVPHVHRVEVDVVRHVQVESHETQLVLLAERNCLALAGSVICEDLEEWGMFGVSLEVEPITKVCQRDCTK